MQHPEELTLSCAVLRKWICLRRATSYRDQRNIHRSMGKRRRERRASGHGTRTPVDPTLEHFEILIGDLCLGAPVAVMVPSLLPAMGYDIHDSTTKRSSFPLPKPPLHLILAVLTVEVCDVTTEMCT